MSAPFLGPCTCPRILGSSIRSAWSSSSASRPPPTPANSRPATGAPRSYDSARSSTSANGGEVWRSTKTTAKKSYLDSGTERTPLGRGFGKPSNNYAQLRPEAQRREDAHTSNLQKDWSPAKLHAMERERARVNSTLKSSGNGWSTAKANAMERERLRAIAVAKTGYIEQEQGSTPADPSSGSGRAYEDRSRGDNGRNNVKSYGVRSEGDAGGQPSGSSSAANRYTNQVARHGLDRSKNQPTNTVKLVAGTYNRSLRDQGSERKIVQPIIRGGAPRKSDGVRIGKKKIRSEMKKVVLPSTIRLENLTNLLGVRLSELCL